MTITENKYTILITATINSDTITYTIDDRMSSSVFILTLYI